MSGSKKKPPTAGTRDLCHIKAAIKGTPKQRAPTLEIPDGMQEMEVPTEALGDAIVLPGW